MAYKAAICDDDKLAIERLKRILLKVSFGTIEFYEYASGEELIQSMGKEYQLIILDVGLEGINGFETAKKVREYDRDAVLVFCSGEFDPTPESIEVVPYRYLKKQYSDEKLEREFTAVLERVREIFDREALVARSRDGEQCRLPLRQIAYISKAKRGCTVHLINDSVFSNGGFTLKKGLEQLYEELETCGFGYAHGSYIVNFRFIRNINGKEMTLENGVILSVARAKRRQFMDAFVKYCGGKYQDYE